MPDTPQQQPPERISKSRIKEEFGFTDAMIRDLLPAPELAPNPYKKNGPPMQLWERDDVELAMLTPAYKNASARADKRAASRHTKTGGRTLAKEQLKRLLKYTCPRCQHHATENLASAATFRCQKCGYFNNIVAVINENTVRIYEKSSKAERGQNGTLDEYGARLWNAIGHTRRP